MKKIILTMEDEVYNNLKSELMIKHISCCFVPSSVIDIFLQLLVKAIDNKDEEVNLEMNKKDKRT